MQDINKQVEIKIFMVYEESTANLGNLFRTNVISSILSIPLPIHSIQEIKLIQ